MEKAEQEERVEKANVKEVLKKEGMWKPFVGQSVNAPEAARADFRYRF